MKKLLLLLTITLCSSAMAQQTEALAYGATTLLNTKNATYDGIEGSAYLGGNDFTKGYMIQDGKTIPNIELRYNAYKDKIEIKISDEKIYMTNPGNDNDFIIRGHHFTRTSYVLNGQETEGYLECLNCDGEIKLYKRHFKVYQEAQQGRTGYHQSTPPKLLSRDEYYLQLPGANSAVEMESSNKKIIQQLGDIDQKMLDYIKDERLKLKKEEDLLRFIEYYNQAI